MTKYISNSETETKRIAAKIAGESQGRIFALTGDLGAGKTIFAQGFAHGLGIREKIISPTFVLMRQYKIPRTTKTFYHLDLYRVENTKELGIKEILADPNSVTLIEWAEKLQKLPKDTIRISINKEGKSKRSLIINHKSLLLYFNL